MPRQNEYEIFKLFLQMSCWYKIKVIFSDLISLSRQSQFIEGSQMHLLHRLFPVFNEILTLTFTVRHM